MRYSAINPQLLDNVAINNFIMGNNCAVAVCA